MTSGITYKFKTDKRTVFEYKRKGTSKLEKDTFTQFSYACCQLGIETETSSVPEFKPRIDGKAIRGATDKCVNGNIPYIVSAYLVDIGISIGQVNVDDKSLDIESCIITIYEDLSRNRKDNALENLSILRKICYNIIKLDTRYDKVNKNGNIVKLSTKRKMNRYINYPKEFEELLFEVILQKYQRTTDNFCKRFFYPNMS